MTWDDREIQEIKRYEGCRLRAYQDSLGVWTIGYGHTHGVQSGDVITQAEADELLEEDFIDAENDARKVCPYFDTLSDPRKGVLVDMSFQLGYQKMSAFHGMLKALEDEDYSSAAAHMRSSLWARQTPARVTELAHRMETNEYFHG